MAPKNLAALLIAINVVRKRKQRANRSIYMRPLFEKRIETGDKQLIKDLRIYPNYHKRYFRMSKETFDTILDKVSPVITKKRTHARPITAMEKLAITLRYLASGNSQISLSMSYRISSTAISSILRETMLEICNYFESTHLPTLTNEMWKGYEEQFTTNWNFPNACGAIDGKHCRFRSPKLSASEFFNYKNFFSVVLLAIANAKYEFGLVDIGSSGSQSDAGILARSPLGLALENKTLALPTPKRIAESVLEILPHVILEDDGFGLKENLMRPSPGKFLPKEMRVFNYRLSRARMVVENAFGILAARFRIFHTPIHAEMDLVKLIIRTTVVLHNMLIRNKDMTNITMDVETDGTLIPGNWRETIETDDGLVSLPRQGSNNHSLNAAAVRNKFKDYFNSEDGACSWQELCNTSIILSNQNVYRNTFYIWLNLLIKVYL